MRTAYIWVRWIVAMLAIGLGIVTAIGLIFWPLQPAFGVVLGLVAGVVAVLTADRWSPTVVMYR